MAEADKAKNEEEIVLAGRENRISPKADCISSMLLMLLGIAFFIESFRMPKFESWGPYAKPGFPPAFFAAILFLLSGLVFIRSVREGGARLGLTRAGMIAFAKADATGRFLFTLITVILFLLAIPYATFLLSSTAFLFVMMMRFLYGSPLRRILPSVAAATAVWLALSRFGALDTGLAIPPFAVLVCGLTAPFRGKGRVPAQCLLLSLLVGFASWYLFKHVFAVPLP